MLIFSVSFQFYRMILERNPKCKRNTSWYTDPPACLQAIAGALASSVAWSDHGRVRAKFCVSIPNEPPRSEHILCARMFAETIRAVLPDGDGDIRCAPCVALPRATVKNGGLRGGWDDSLFRTNEVTHAQSLRPPKGMPLTMDPSAKRCDRTSTVLFARTHANLIVGVGPRAVFQMWYAHLISMCAMQRYVGSSSQAYYHRRNSAIDDSIGTS